MTPSPRIQAVLNADQIIMDKDNGKAMPLGD
jgi:hypothetical protein